MFFSFFNTGGFFQRGATQAAINVANIAFVEFGAIKTTPFATVYLHGHDRVFTITGREDVDRLRQAIGLEAADTLRPG
jgi:hypothetical protein